MDLASFGAAKRSDRVILRLSSDRELAPEDSLRLREAVFTDYLDGVWTRDPRVGARRGDRAAHAAPVPEARPGGSALISVDLNVLGQGFLFLPYGSSAVEVERGRAVELPDGVMQVSSVARPGAVPRGGPPDARARRGARRDLSGRRPRRRSRPTPSR